MQGGGRPSGENTRGRTDMKLEGEICLSAPCLPRHLSGVCVPVNTKSLVARTSWLS